MTRASYRRSVAFGGLTSVGMMVLGLVSSIAIARIYGVHIIGEFALATAPALALNYLSTIREQTALVRALAVLPARDERVTALFFAVSCFSTVLTVTVATVVLVITVGAYHGAIGHPELIAPAAAFLASAATLQNWCWNVDTVLSSFRAGKELFVVRLTQAATLLLVAVALGVGQASVWSLFAATAASWAVALLLRLVYVRRFMRFTAGSPAIRDAFRELPAMLRFGAKLAPAGIANGVSAQVGTFFLGASVPLAAMGAYNRAQQLGTRFLEANARLAEVLLPTLVERDAVGDRTGYDRATIDSIRYAALAFLLPAAAGGGAAAGVLGLFGPGFDDASGALVWILLVPALAAVSNVYAQALVASSRPSLVTLVAVARLALTTAMTFTLVRWLGVTGAGAAWAIGYAAGIAWSHALVRRQLSESLRRLWPVRQMAVLPLAYALGFAGARLVDQALAGPGGLLAALSVGSAAYVTALVALGAFGERDRTRWRQMRQRLSLRHRGRLREATEKA